MLIVNGTELVDLVAGKVKAYTDATMSHSFFTFIFFHYSDLYIGDLS